MNFSVQIFQFKILAGFSVIVLLRSIVENAALAMLGSADNPSRRRIVEAARPRSARRFRPGYPISACGSDGKCAPTLSRPHRMPHSFFRP